MLPTSTTSTIGVDSYITHVNFNLHIFGFRHYFLFLAGTALLGIVIILLLLRLRRRGNLWPPE